MSTLLVIQAYSNDKSAHLDRLNQHFITSYRQAHPKDRIIFHDLIKDSTPTLNSQMLMALRKKQHQKPLSAFEQKLLCEHDDWLNDFMLADKYLFVAPIQQRFLPTELKQYLDLIVATLTEMAPTKKPYISKQQIGPIIPDHLSIFGTHINTNITWEINISKNFYPSTS